MASSSSISQTANSKWLLYSFAAIIIVSSFLATLLQEPLLLALPAIAFFGFIAIVDFKWIYLGMFAIIPISIEFDTPIGFAIDLPIEPVMIFSMVFYLLVILASFKQISSHVFRHPISILIYCHLAWIFFTALTSTYPLISFKFFLAKVWYVIPCFFLSMYMLNDYKRVQTLFWFIAIPLSLATVWVIFNHSLEGFSFKSANFVMKPFFRNHVNYACILSLFLPYLFFMRKHYAKGSLARNSILLMFGITLVGIYFSYTRTARISLYIAIAIYWVVKLKLLRYAIGSAIIAAIIGISYLVQENKYLSFAPNFETTVTHTKYDNLMAATVKGEDVSTMERVYRWVAGYYMVRDRPIKGFGPGTFYENYETYTVKSFQTYISDNIEKSGIHCYYLMILAEQGFIGLLIFLALCIYALVRAEKIYHREKSTKLKDLIMISILSFIIILSILLINDMLETHKIGPFFLLALAFIVNIDLKKIKVGQTTLS